MDIEPIPNFNALEFKKRAQNRVQSELSGLAPKEKLQRLRDGVGQGPFADWWKSLRAAEKAKAKAALEEGEHENAA